MQLLDLCILYITRIYHILEQGEIFLKVILVIKNTKGSVALTVYIVNFFRDVYKTCIFLL